VSTLRDAARLAITALEFAQQGRECPSTTRQAIVGLRAGLAEPQPQPAAWIEPSHLTEIQERAETAGYPLPLIASTAQNTPEKVPLFLGPEHAPIVQEAQRLQCICHACIKEFDLRSQGSLQLPLNMTQMIVCPRCGNKRCPKANDHRNACTNSNATGQPGSAY
jgi:hypothetical protein